MPHSSREGNTDQASDVAHGVTSDAVQVEIWSDIACPWCYIGKARFTSALAQSDRRDHIEVVWRSYQLSPDTPVGARETELAALVRMKGMAPDQVRGMFDHVATVAADDGLAIDFDTVVAANTFDAHRLVHIAHEQGRATEMLDALFTAHFVEGKVVDDLDVLVETARTVGVTGAQQALASGGGAASVEADLAEAAKLKVTGVPFFVADRRLAVSGAQPVAVFKQLLDRI